MDNYVDAIPLSEYPRPQMRRQSYMCLNGRWELKFLSDGSDAKVYSIMVPYSPECAYSGVNRTLQAHETMLYSRHVEFPEPIDFSSETLLLHFGAVDYRAIVFIDKEQVFEHLGGYLPFTVQVDSSSFDLDVSVQDPGDTAEICRGKQSSMPGGIWYPKQSGIWQTVWMEKVPRNHIESLKIVPDLTGFDITVNMSLSNDVNASLCLGETKYDVQPGSKTRIEIENPRLWSPEDPYLYDFTLSCAGDSVDCYTGLRTYGTGFDEKGNKVLYLNGEPYFHNGLLDQGYYKDGLYTPLSDKQAEDDISLMKEMGFNTLRKHIKVEPLRWYYHCDRIGMLVWQDMVNGGGEYNKMVISSPLVRGSYLKDDEYKAFSRLDVDERVRWENELCQMITHLGNVVSIAMWVPFNEGWGQFDSERICDLIRTLDYTRTIDHASGWHDQGIGDFRSLHVYFRPYRFRPDKKGRAVILSEFGGYGFDTNTTNKKAFVYKRFTSSEKLTAAVVKLYRKQIIPAKKKGLAACIYTQVSDVEQEVNGLVTYDRRTVKVDIGKMAAVNKELVEA